MKWTKDHWLAFVVVASSFICGANAVDCYTCNVDFRNQKFDQNNSCLFPTKENERTTCSQVSRFCQGVITRINGVFVQLQRTCERDCQETCTEKGYGIETRECKFCCPKSPDCGRAGYKTSNAIKPCPCYWFIIMILTLMWGLKV
ncbi:hypothetical protein JTE90_027813 [Oedothorax gibbosus]|uniref:Uncharacterized protein n=1 Tax=Oedothorax gibbosus TaxID=931172 RepID=A0AAV6V896_9ARAC|nr:hypothetical protein JTE90_027813 [Oedothorax gibbosus]